MQKAWTLVIPTVESTKGFKSIIQNVKKNSSLFYPRALASICVSIRYLKGVEMPRYSRTMNAGFHFQVF